MHNAHPEFSNEIGGAGKPFVVYNLTIEWLVTFFLPSLKNQLFD